MQSEIKKNISSPTEGKDLLLKTIKYNPISGETVPLSYAVVN
jgi:hypothetical protein